MGAGEGRGGEGRVEWGTLAQRYGCKFSVNEVASVIFSSMCVKPHAGMHSPEQVWRNLVLILPLFLSHS